MFFRARRIEQKLDLLLERNRTIMSQLDDLVSAINTETNLLAEAVEADAKVISDLRAQLAAAPTVTQTTLDTLASVATRLAGSTNRLKSIGADPANPVPSSPPAPVAPAPAETTPGS